MVKFFPSKTMDNWLRSKFTKKFIIVIEKFLKPSNVTELKGGNSTLLKLEDFGKRDYIPKGSESIKTKRGKDGVCYASNIYFPFLGAISHRT